MIEQERQKAFTPRALFLGFMGVVLISGSAGFVELRMPFAPPLIGSHLPAGPFFLILLLALGWNSLVRRFPSLSLNSRELVVIMAMILVACFPPTAGFFRHFQRQLTLPWYYLSAGVAESSWTRWDGRSIRGSMDG